MRGERRRIGAPEHVDQHARVIDGIISSRLVDDDLVNAIFHCEGRMCFSLFLFIYLNALEAHNSARFGVARARSRARERYIYMCIDMCRRWSPSSIVVYMSRVGRREAPVRAIRVCHCTGRTRRRVTSIPPLRGLYNTAGVSRREDETAGESPRRTWRFSVSRLAAAVPRLPSRVDRCAHRAADNAVVATTSVHSTRRRPALRAHTGHTPNRENDDNPVASDVNSRARAVAPRNDPSSDRERGRGGARSSADSIDRYLWYHSRSAEGWKGETIAARRHPDGRPVAIRVSLGRMLRTTVYQLDVYFTSTASRRSFAPNENRYGRGKKSECNRYRWREGRCTTGAGHASARIKSWEYSAPSSAIYRVGKNQTYRRVRERVIVCVCVILCVIPCIRRTM